MPNRNYQKGVRFERDRKNYYNLIGHECYRTAGSHGSFDLIAVDTRRAIVTLVQCKVTSSLSTAERLIRQFRETPPLTPMKNIHQTLWVKVNKEKLSVTV